MVHGRMQHLIFCEGRHSLLCRAAVCETGKELASARCEGNIPAFFQEYRTVKVAAKLRRSTFSGNTTRKNTPTRY